MLNSSIYNSALDLYKFLKSLLNEANILLGGVNKLNLRIVDKNFGTEEEPIIKQVVEFYDEVSPFVEDKVFYLNGNAKGVYYLNFSHPEFSKTPNFNLELIEKNKH